jgi:trans-2,3-dihydro-3-hydroxyanthranilate isomerase
MTIPFYIVDVFAENKYSGNQLAVFLDAEKLSDEEMLKITREINFAESTFVTAVFPESAMATIRIFTPQHEMQFAGHPIIGTSWVLMNKVLENNPQEITLSVPIGHIPVFQETDLVWLQAAQPEFLNTLNKEDFLLFSNLAVDDFDSRFSIQEVSTGSAFVIVALKSLKILENLNFDKDKMDIWMRTNCGTNHRALYFFCLEDEKLSSRMFCIENNQLVEDAATGSASSCLQAFLLKYHSSEIKTINYQGDFINRPSQIYFNGMISGDHFDIRIGGKIKFIAKGEWSV